MRRVGKPNVARRRGKHFPLDIVSRSPNSGVGTWGFFPDPKQTIFRGDEDEMVGRLVFNSRSSRRRRRHSKSSFAQRAEQQRCAALAGSGSERKKRLHFAYKVERKISFLCK